MDDLRVSKADLHVHSKYSDRPSEWFLRRIARRSVLSSRAKCTGGLGSAGWIS